MMWRVSRSRRAERSPAAHIVTMSSFDIPTLERRLCCAVRGCAGEGVFVIGSGSLRGEMWDVLGGVVSSGGYEPRRRSRNKQWSSTCINTSAHKHTHNKHTHANTYTSSSSIYNVPGIGHALGHFQCRLVVVVRRARRHGAVLPARSGAGPCHGSGRRRGRSAGARGQRGSHRRNPGPASKRCGRRLLRRRPHGQTSEQAAHANANDPRTTGCSFFYVSKIGYK